MSSRREESLYLPPNLDGQSRRGRFRHCSGHSEPTLLLLDFRRRRIFLAPAGGYELMALLEGLDSVHEGG